MKQSLRTGITILMIVMIVISFTFAAFYSVEIYRSAVNQIASNSAPALHAVWTTFSANLDMAEHYLNSIAYDSAIMEDLGSTADPTQLYASSSALCNAYSPLLYADPTIAGIVVCDNRTGITHSVYGHLTGNTGQARVAQKEQIQNTVEKMIEDMTLNLSEWDAAVVGDTRMLYRAIYWAGAYSVCLVDLDSVITYYAELYKLSGTLSIAKDGVWLNTPDNTAKAMDDGSPINDSAVLVRNANTLILSQKGSDLELYCFVPLGDISGRISTMQTLILVTAALCVLVVLFTSLYLRHQFILPMNDLMDSMERIRGGDLEAHPSSRYNSTEFRAVNETFNSMIASLQSAKILAYEKNLENQRMRFNTLRLQIRPHFYLNCLKSIYASAALEDTEKVRAQILYLSTHLRYCFSDQGPSVPLRKELEMCENYLKLLSLNHAAQIHFDIEDPLMDFTLPPMTILTAVENAARYYKTPDTAPNMSLTVTISARVLHIESSPLVNITIQDNGPGFSEEAMKLIHHPTSDHIGISNVIQQLRFYFGPDCEVTFTNHHGAQINFYIPVKEDPHESADR